MAGHNAGLSVVPPTHEAQASVRAAADLSERALLVALRDQIAAEIDRGVPAHALAPLSRQLRDIAREIRQLDASGEGDDIGAAAAVPDEEWTAR